MKKALDQAQAGLSKLIEQTQLYQALLEVAQEALPRRIAPHLIGVSFEGKTLVLQLDDNLWKSKLRFYENEILALYQQHFPHLQLSRVQIRVLPLQAERKPTKVQMDPPDKETGAKFFHLSESVQSEGLKKVLQRLGGRAFK